MSHNAFAAFDLKKLGLVNNQIAIALFEYLIFLSGVVVFTFAS
ncbi:hypothetical protein [Nostoc sp.]